MKSLFKKSKSKNIKNKYSNKNINFHKNKKSSKKLTFRGHLKTIKKILNTNINDIFGIKKEAWVTFGHLNRLNILNLMLDTFLVLKSVPDFGKPY